MAITGQYMLLCLILIFAFLPGCNNEGRYNHLPIINHKYLAISKEGGIKDLCFIKQTVDEVVKKLGRPDYYRVPDGTSCLPSTGFLPYSKYGLEIVLIGERVSSINVSFQGSNISKIRFFDKEELAASPSLSKVFALFGEPKKRYVRDDQFYKEWKNEDSYKLESVLLFDPDESFLLRYLINDWIYLFRGEKNKVTSLAIHRSPHSYR